MGLRFPVFSYFTYYFDKFPFFFAAAKHEDVLTLISQFFFVKW